MQAMNTTDEVPSPDPAPDSPQAEPSAPGHHRLTRSTSDRMIAGVAGGLGEYFDIDPMIVRIGFVLLGVFGGSSIGLYLLAWLLLPEDGQSSSIAEDVIGHRRGWGRGRHPRAATILLIVVAALALSHSFWFFSEDHRLWPLILIGIGVALLGNRRRAHRTGLSPANAEWSSAATSWLSSEPHPPSVAPYLVAGLVILAGASTLVSLAGWLSVSIPGVLAVGLVLAGVALVVGTVRGRVGGVAVLAVLLASILALSLAVPGSVVDGIGNRVWRPVSADELTRSYHLGIGHGVLDLRSVVPSGELRTVRASVGIGNLEVIVPAGVDVRVRERASIGETALFGDQKSGLSVDRTIVDGQSGPIGLRLDLRVGFGEVQVDRGT